MAGRPEVKGYTVKCANCGFASSDKGELAKHFGECKPNKSKSPKP